MYAKKMPVLNRAVGKSWDPPAARPSHAGCGCSAAVWPTGSAWDGSCCGADTAHKVPGCAYRVYPIGTLLLLGSFPALPMFPALPVLADIDNSVTTMCFLSLTAGKRQYWAAGTFTEMLQSSWRVHFPYIFYILKYLGCWMLQMLCLLLIWKHEHFILNKWTKNFYQGHLIPQK